MDRSRFLMFFYGTLKRGHRNHEPFCRGGSFVTEATVRGRLYDLPAGYPALVVPETDVRATGTADYPGDAELSNRVREPETAGPNGPEVFGELYAFDDPEARLPALDDLEGFVPRDPSSPYRRVLIPVRPPSGKTTLAWAYVTDGTDGTWIPGGRWPP